MRYNIFIQAGYDQTLTLLSEEDLRVILDAYAEGNDSFTIKGRKVDISRLTRIWIYETDISNEEFNQIEGQYEEQKKRQKFGLLSQTWSPEKFEQIGKEVTGDLIGNNSLGWKKGLTLIQGSIELTQTFWSLIHDSIKNVAKPRFDSNQYADAVEAAFKELNDCIKKEYKAKNSEELDGKDLMMKAFSDTPTAFKLVDTSSTSGKNIQEGYKFIFAGSWIGIRNPKAHRNLVIDQSDAIEKIFLASHLQKIFENRLS